MQVNDIHDDNHVESSIELKPNEIKLPEIEWSNQSNNESWAEVIEKWKNDFHIRQSDIKMKSCNILDIWPLFKHHNGFILVDNDYNLLFPNKPSKIFTKWPEFAIKALKYFKMNVKDKKTILILNDNQNFSSLGM